MLAHKETEGNTTASVSYGKEPMTKVASQAAEVKTDFLSKWCWNNGVEFLFKFGVEKGFLTMTQNAEKIKD